MTEQASVTVSGPKSSCVNENLADGDIALAGVDVELGVAGHEGSAAKVTWHLAGVLPKIGTALLTLTAVSSDQKVRKQLGYKTLDGQQIAYYVCSGSSQSNLHGYPDTRVEGSISGVLPSAAVDELGSGWSWRAVLNVDGRDVDFCPS